MVFIATLLMIPRLCEPLPEVNHHSPLGGLCIEVLDDVAVT